MKIIHTSDWHLGQNFYRFDREAEHRHFFAQLSQIMERERADALVVSGDIYHTSAPSASATKLLVDGIIQLHDASPETVIVITAGNHDSGSRLEAERELWRRIGVHVIGSCWRRDNGTFDPAQFIINIPDKGHIIAAPYFHPTNYPLASSDTDRENRQRQFFALLLSKIADDSLPIVMMAHLAVMGCDTTGHEDQPIGGMMKESLAELGSGYDYLALGHIHRPQSVSARAYYSGSVIPVSFSEDFDHTVNIVQISRRGELPTVTPISLDTHTCVKTIPAEGAPLEEALKALADLDPGDTSYVRMLVDQDGIIDADAEERARALVRDKQCKFCEMRRKPRIVKADTDIHAYEYHGIEQFKLESPLEIACRSYRREFDSDMPVDLADLMDKAIKEVEKSKSE